MSSSRPWNIRLAIASTFLTTLAMNHLDLRKTQEAERDRMEGRISVLEDLLAKYRSGVSVGDAEVQRLLRLADVARTEEVKQADLSWAETVFGQKPDLQDEEKEMELLKAEWNRALTGKASSSGP